VTPPVRFFYDFSSPYSYLAARRVRAVVGSDVAWTPVFFGAILQAAEKTPWSWREDRSADFAEIARRAGERGLPELHYPEGWPRETWSAMPLRAAILAGDEIAALSLALFDEHFVRGRILDDDAVRDAARATGLDGEALVAAAGGEDARARLRSNTADAIEAGVTGVPTLAVGDELFWGDDRLGDAGAAKGSTRGESSARG